MDSSADLPKPIAYFNQNNCTYHVEMLQNRPNLQIWTIRNKEKYRPISILPVLSKTREKAVQQR